MPQALHTHHPAWKKGDRTCEGPRLSLLVPPHTHTSALPTSEVNASLNHSHCLCTPPQTMDCFFSPDPNFIYMASCCLHSSANCLYHEHGISKTCLCCSKGLESICPSSILLCCRSNWYPSRPLIGLVSSWVVCTLSAVTNRAVLHIRGQAFECPGQVCLVVTSMGHRKQCTPHFADHFVRGLMDSQAHLNN